MRNKKLLTGMLATMLSVSMVLSSASITKAQEMKSETEVLEAVAESEVEEFVTGETFTEVETEEITTDGTYTEMETEGIITEEVSNEAETEEIVTEATEEYEAIFSEVGQTVKVERQKQEETKKFLVACEKSGDYTLRYSDTDGDMESILFTISKESGRTYTGYLKPFTGFTGVMNEDYESNITLHLESGKTYVVTIESAAGRGTIAGSTTEKEISYELTFKEEPTVTGIRVDHESYIVEAGGSNWWGLSGGFPFVVTYSDGSEQHLHGPRNHWEENEIDKTDYYLPYDDYGNYFVFKLKDETQEYAYDHMRAGVYPVTITVSDGQVFEDVVKIQDPYELAGNTVIRLDQNFINEKAAEVESAKENTNIIIDMKNKDGQIATVVPAEILEAALGRNVNVILNMGSYTWTINGEDIWAEEIVDVNLEVKLNSNAIPSEKVKELAKDKVTHQISLTSDGWFGFDTTLTVNVGNEYKGQYGSLYYYNDGEFELQSKGIIAQNGYVNFDFSHASDYVIVIEENADNKDETNNGQTTGNESNKGESTGNENESPKTGEVNNIYVWFVLFAGAGLVFSKTAMKRKLK